MGWPQVIYLALQAAGLGVVLSKHGETVRHNFWVSVVTTAIVLSILYWGGFFN